MKKIKILILSITICLILVKGHSSASNYMLFECYSSDNLDKIILNVDGDSIKASYLLQTNYNNDWITIIKGEGLDLKNDVSKQIALIDDIANSTSISMSYDIEKGTKIIYTTAVSKKIVFEDCSEI